MSTSVAISAQIVPACTSASAPHSRSAAAASAAPPSASASAAAAASVASLMALRPAMIPAHSLPVKLGLDVGGVLSPYGSPRCSPGEEWAGVAHGAWPFVYFFSLKYGANNLAVISRVNHFPRRGNTHFVEQLASAAGIVPWPRGVGVPPSNIQLVKEKRTRGRPAPKCS